MSARSFVLDASATLAWCFDEDGLGSRIGSIIGESKPMAPWLWRLEVANAIMVKERRRILSAADGARLLDLLDALGVEVVGEPPGRTISSIANLARRHQLSSYDAVYLELAASASLPLLTTDDPLRAAAKREGVKLVAVARGA